MKRAILAPAVLAAGLVAMAFSAPSADAATVKLQALNPTATGSSGAKNLHGAAYYDITKRGSIRKVCVELDGYSSTKNCGPIQSDHLSGAIGSHSIKCGAKGTIHGVKSLAWFENGSGEQIGDKQRSQLIMIPC